MTLKNGIPQLSYYALLDWKDSNRKEWNELSPYDSLNDMSVQELNAVIAVIYIKYKHLPLVGYSVPTIQTITFDEPKSHLGEQT